MSINTQEVDSSQFLGPTLSSKEMTFSWKNGDCNSSILYQGTTENVSENKLRGGVPILIDFHQCCFGRQLTDWSDFQNHKSILSG